MNNYKSYFILTLLFLLLPITSVKSVLFEHLNTSHGLSDNSVVCITQDSLGMIWLGTRYGLNSYDGTRISQYYTNSNNNNSLPENRIKNIKSKNMKLYIQLLSYLSIYDIKNQEFKNFHIPDISAISLGEHNKLWIGSSNLLYYLNTSDNTLNHERLKIPDSETITSLEYSKKGLLIGTDKSLYIYDSNKELNLIVEDVNTISISYSKNNNIWLATLDKGVFKIDENNIIKNYKSPIIPNDFVRCAFEEDNGSVWFGTIDGLVYFNSENGKTNLYNNNPSDFTNLSHNSVWSIYKSPDNILYVGTYFGGLNMCMPDKESFNYVPVDVKDNKGLNFNIVGPVSYDNKNNLYIGTEGGGLNCYNKTTGLFTYYTHNKEDKYSIPCNNIKDIVNHKDSVLIIATHTGGLTLFNLENKNFNTIISDKDKLINIVGVNDIEETKDDNKYILSTQQGIYMFDITTCSVTKFISDELHQLIPQKVTASLNDNSGRIWIGTEYSGLFVYNTNNGSYHQYNYNSEKPEFSIKSNTINYINQDDKGRIWVSTQSGLYLYRQETDDFIVINTGKGLPSDVTLKTLYLNEEDCLIVTTNKGISKINIEDKTIENLSTENGLPLNIINNNSIFKIPGDIIVVGGYNGLVYFKTSALKSDYDKRNIRVTNLKVNQQNITSSDTTNILTSNILFTEEIELDYNQNTLEIYFSEIGKIKGIKENLKYKLEGFDKDFIVADISENKASYTNLPAGRYKFIVRHISEDENNGNQAQLDIIINSPFYFSTWAYIIYILTIISIIIVLNRLYLQRKYAVERLNNKNKEQEIEREYNQAKFRFFTNVSHDLRTPLTLMSVQLEEILNSSTNKGAVYRNVLSAYNNTGKLRKMVDELLDFRKQEEGHFVLHPVNADIKDTIREVYNNFIELAVHQSITFKLNNCTDSLFMIYDKSAIEKVLYNVISNAFKNTQSGSVDISIDDNDETLIIKISDTGIGIPQEHIDKIFDSYYRIDSNHKNSFNKIGTGLGLTITKQILEQHKGEISVESEIEKGSVFTISIPKATGLQAVDESNNKLDIDDTEDIESIISSLSIKNTKEKSTILIVEDNIEMQQLLNRILSTCYIVYIASDGVEGLQKAKDIQPDLILSDVMMPNMSGNLMCTTLKQDTNTSHIPVVLLTARTSIDHKIEGLSVGADAYITKPFSIKLLIARIENILYNREILRKKVSDDIFTISSDVKSGNDIDNLFISKACETIQKNIDNSLYSVSEFAVDMGMSRTIFFRKIKTLTDLTPNEFILSIRLRYSMKLLTENEYMSIAEISDRCGFSSPQYFSNCFKRKFEMTPIQFRKKTNSAETEFEFE